MMPTMIAERERATMASPNANLSTGKQEQDSSLAYLLHPLNASYLNPFSMPSISAAGLNAATLFPSPMASLQAPLPALGASLSSWCNPPTLESPLNLALLGVHANATNLAQSDQESAEQWYQLARVYKEGNNTLFAIECYKSAAQKGSTKAMYELGTCYMFGEGLPMDRTMAMTYISMAAQRGLNEALNMMGNCYYSPGSIPGMQRDLTRAIGYYSTAARQGYHESAISLEQVVQELKYNADHGDEKAKTIWNDCVKLGFVEDRKDPNEKTRYRDTSKEARAIPRQDLGSKNEDLDSVGYPRSFEALSRNSKEKKYKRDQPRNYKDSMDQEEAQSPGVSSWMGFSREEDDKTNKAKSLWATTDEINELAVNSEMKSFPLEGPMPSHFQGDWNKVLLKSPHSFLSSVINYHPVKGEETSPKRRCVMCGEIRCARTHPHYVRNDSDSPSEPTIAKQNKGVCSTCSDKVWVESKSGIQIKFCKGCKRFRPWIAWGTKGTASKCIKCRERQKRLYRTKQGLKKAGEPECNGY